ncbi:LOW QUALITY PROTEIN: hypothetical protein BSKO_10853 [Bryopsis sp. KO-2023]|nr:LOW QUALITY PROTEIN: hypothetical protein BSKO_10853 [Bryopsis sp. KO-2023]
MAEQNWRQVRQTMELELAEAKASLSGFDTDSQIEFSVDIYNGAMDLTDPPQTQMHLSGGDFTGYSLTPRSHDDSLSSFEFSKGESDEIQLRSRLSEYKAKVRSLRGSLRGSLQSVDFAEQSCREAAEMLHAMEAERNELKGQLVIANGRLNNLDQRQRQEGSVGELESENRHHQEVVMSVESDLEVLRVESDRTAMEKIIMAQLSETDFSRKDEMVKSIDTLRRDNSKLGSRLCGMETKLEQTQVKLETTVIRLEEAKGKLLGAQGALREEKDFPVEREAGGEGVEFPRGAEQGKKKKARMQFLRVLRTLPYGNSVFFSVKRIEDPIGLLPAKLILGINKRGVHFFRPVPKEYLHSAELRDIMQFGSSSQAVFFKMRVAGVLHIFQFETRQGEDICMALQTHINDIMMKRYAKAKAMAQADSRTSVLVGDNTLGVANFGPKYKEHLDEMQKLLEAKTRKGEELIQRNDGYISEKERLEQQFEECMTRVLETEKVKSEIQEVFFRLRKEADKMRARLDKARAMLGAAEAVKIDALNQAKQVGVEHSTQVRELEILCDQQQKEHEVLNTMLEKMEDEYEQICREKLLTEKKMARIGKAKEGDIQRMKEALKNAEHLSKGSIHEKDIRVNQLQEELADMTAMFNANRAELDEIKTGQNELQALREMKSDIQSREKSQADIIMIQSKRLEEVEKAYKTEQVGRKRYFNTMEDLKGKIRVYCRARPMLPMEEKAGQTFALNLPDELTISHMWRERKPREYSFDAVPPEASQEQVFADTSHLVQSAVDEYNMCIFAYGQTGSGKTHTIYGYEDNLGMTPRGINELFRVLNRDRDKYNFCVTCYMLELYQDHLQDLLRKTEEQTKLEMVKLLKSLLQRASSRSHLIMSIVIHSTNMQTQTYTRKLSFVDLAGSERVKKSKSTGERFKEAQAINKSLSALGDVISCLASGAPHIPYRNHKLTMLMSDSLGGNAKTLMFVNVSPSDSNIDETQNSLQYAILTF